MPAKSLPTVTFDDMKRIAERLGVAVEHNDNAAWLARRVVTKHPTYKRLLERSRSDQYVVGLVEVIAEDLRQADERLDAASASADPFDRARMRVVRHDTAIRLDAEPPRVEPAVALESDPDEAFLARIRGKISPAALAEVSAALKSAATASKGTVPVTDAADPFAAAAARITGGG